MEWINASGADVLVVSANTKGYFRTGRIQPFLMFGTGLMTIETSPMNSDKGFALRLGAGVDYNLTTNVVVGFTMEYVNSFSLDFDYMMIGPEVQWRF